MWLLFVSCSWIAGIYSGSIISLPCFLFLISLVPIVISIVKSTYRCQLIIFSVSFIAFVGGNIIFSSSVPFHCDEMLSKYNDTETISFHGKVIDDPDIRDTFCYLTIKADVIILDNEEMETTGKCLVRTTRYPSFHYGDCMYVTGQLETPTNYSDFDYKTYLSRKDILSIMYYPYISRTPQATRMNPLKLLYAFREKLSVSLLRNLPEPEASIAQGMLLGIRNSIPDQLYEEFSMTGTSHLLAISGLHVSILIVLLLNIFSYIVGKQHSIYIWIVLSIIIFYVILTGLKPPVVRASIMATVFLFAELFGRQKSAIVALVFSAAVMVAIDPQLLWNISFQLSFMAMTGLIIIYPYTSLLFNKLLARISNGDVANSILISGLINTLAITLAVIITTCPLIAYHFNIFSLVSLPANFFALPSLPLILVNSAMLAITGIFLPDIAQVFGWVNWIFLRYLLLVVDKFSSFKYCFLEPPELSFQQIGSYYLILCVILVYLKERRHISQFVTRLVISNK